VSGSGSNLDRPINNIFTDIFSIWKYYQLLTRMCLQCSDAVGWSAGRASSP